MRLQKILTHVLPEKGPCNYSDLACLNWPAMDVTMNVKNLKLNFQISCFNASKKMVIKICPLYYHVFPRD